MLVTLSNTKISQDQALSHVKTHTNHQHFINWLTIIAWWQLSKCSKIKTIQIWFNSYVKSSEPKTKNCGSIRRKSRFSNSRSVEQAPTSQSMLKGLTLTILLTLVKISHNRYMGMLTHQVTDSAHQTKVRWTHRDLLRPTLAKWCTHSPATRIPEGIRCCPSTQILQLLVSLW